MIQKNMLLALLAIPCFLQADLKVALVVNEQEVVNEWELSLDEKEYPKSVLLTEDVRFELTSVEVTEDAVEISAKMFLIEGEQEALVSETTFRTSWNEKSAIVVGQVDEKELAFVFAPEKD